MNNNEKIEILELYDFNDKNKIDSSNNNDDDDNKNSKIKIWLRTIPLIMIPILFLLTVISLHTKRLVKVPFNYISCVLLSIFIYLFIIGLFKIKKSKKSSKRKKTSNIIGNIMLTIYILGCFGFTFLLYGPYDNFRTWLISTAMSTMNHQYLCKWFYNDDEILKVIKGNYIVEVNEETNTDLIDMKEEITYDNEYEEQILKHNKDEKYKIIELEVNGQKGYLAAIYDPSMVKVSVTKSLGVKGQLVTKMAEDNKAMLAVNGGGFYDPGNNSTGGMPTGVTISNGKVITDNNYSSYTQSGGIIGITNDNKLVLIKGATAQKALNMNVRDGVSWGPFLIVNGKKSFIKGNGGWGYAARTAIGQRSDGIILLLVINSNSSRTKGADMVDLTDIMDKYGAINAANLDGGTSTVMVLPQKEALKYKDTCTSTYCYINDPVDGALRHRTRAIATSIIVTDK